MTLGGCALCYLKKGVNHGIMGKHLKACESMSVHFLSFRQRMATQFRCFSAKMCFVEAWFNSSDSLQLLGWPPVGHVHRPSETFRNPKASLHPGYDHLKFRVHPLARNSFQSLEGMLPWHLLYLVIMCCFTPLDITSLYLFTSTQHTKRRHCDMAPAPETAGAAEVREVVVENYDPKSSTIQS